MDKTLLERAREEVSRRYSKTIAQTLKSVSIHDVEEVEGGVEVVALLRFVTSEPYSHMYAPMKFFVPD